MPAGRHLSPDAYRYLLAGQGARLTRPFHLRVALPALCGDRGRAWRIVWAASWPVAAFGFVWWQGWTWQALAGAAMFLALPGVLGPDSSIPVQVDMPATALTLLGCGVFTLSHPVQQAAGVVVIALAASVRETAPVAAALWLWSPWPLLALAVPSIVHLVHRPAKECPSGLVNLQHVHDHPFRSAIEAHAGRWRDGWLMVAPWGACLAALHAPTWPLVAVLVVAYGQLLAATDTVRLVHHLAGPVMAAIAANVIPPSWLLLTVVVHAVWWRVPERI